MARAMSRPSNPPEPESRPENVVAATLVYALIAVVAVRFVTLAFYPILDKTEARYAEIALRMAANGDWITLYIEPNTPFWAKPPLSTWASAISYLVFGVNAFAARLPSFVAYALGLGLIYRFGTEARDRLFGISAALALASMALAFYLGGAVMTDPALAISVTLVMVAFWKAIGGAGRAWGYLFFVGCAVALLAKGPVGVVLPALSIGAWVAWQKKWREIWQNLPWFAGTALTLAIALPWYIAAERSTPGFLEYFIFGEHFARFLVPGWKGDLYGSGRAFPIGSIWLFALIATLPWSLVYLRALVVKRERAAVFPPLVRDPWLGYVVCWALAPLVFFTFARNILITYAATSLPAFALLAAHALRSIGQDRDYRVPALAAIAPAVALALVAAVEIAPDNPRLPTERGIIAAYERLKPSGRYELIYLFEKPYSADFYSRLRARIARTPEQARRLIEDPAGEAYFVVARSALASLPEDLRRRLEVAASGQKSLLLHRKSGD
jgi:4-amino-4-deoxy-L-arabinose transferase-like glycosyltransferase